MIQLAKVRLKEAGLKNIINLEKADCLEKNYQSLYETA